TTIFVAKLDFGVTENELFSKFGQFGTVAKVNVAKDKETGKPRGFAFVEMPNAEEAQVAIKEMDGYAFNGRSCVVKQADDRGGSNNSFKPRDNAGFKPRTDRQYDNSQKPYNKFENRGPKPEFQKKDDSDMPPMRPIHDDDDVPSK